MDFLAPRLLPSLILAGSSDRLGCMSWLGQPASRAGYLRSASARTTTLEARSASRRHESTCPPTLVEGIFLERRGWAVRAGSGVIGVALDGNSPGASRADATAMPSLQNVTEAQRARSLRGERRFCRRRFNRPVSGEIARSSPVCHFVPALWPADRTLVVQFAGASVKLVRSTRTLRLRRSCSV